VEVVALKVVVVEQEDIENLLVQQPVIQRVL
jgi:hypothetical protein